MLPRYHILLGAIFTIVLYFLVPGVSLFYLGLVFLSSFLIDFDHYINAVKKNKSLSFGRSFEYYKDLGIREKKEINAGIRRKSDFHLFHTIEFHALIGILGIFWIGFYYVFIGMIFHSLLDVLSLGYYGRFHRREYFLSNWIRKKI